MVKAMAVKKGKYQIQEVTYNKKGKSTVKALSGWKDLPKSIKKKGLKYK